MLRKTIGNVWQNFLTDSLFRNSVYLMLTTGMMGGFGFIFWTISTHLFTPKEIGLGTTIISSMTMISYIGLFGFNNTLIRYLPTTKDSNKTINTGVNFVVVLNIALTLIYFLFISYLTPNLVFIRSSLFLSALFLLSVILTSLNSLTDSIFVAYRSAKYNLITDGLIMSISKIFFPVILVGLGAFGVFLSLGLATLVCLVVSTFILYIKFNYRPKLEIDRTETKKIFAFSLTSYLGSLFSTAPTLILPIIINNNLSPEDAGYFYLSFMIMNLLYSVSASTSQSLFAEGSYADSKLLPLLKKTLKIIMLILIPASLFFAFVGPLLLEIFGKNYSDGAKSVIVLLSISSPIISMFNLANTILKIRQHIYALIYINAIYAVTVCGLAYLWVGKGLIWVTYAWILGNLLSMILSFAIIYFYRGMPTPKA